MPQHWLGQNIGGDQCHLGKNIYLTDTTGSGQRHTQCCTLRLYPYICFTRSELFALHSEHFAALCCTVSLPGNRSLKRPSDDDHQQAVAQRSKTSILAFHMTQMQPSHKSSGYNIHALAWALLPEEESSGYLHICFIGNSVMHRSPLRPKRTDLCITL